MKSRTVESFVKRACALGAAEAKVIEPKSIVTAPWVRMKCQFGCGGFGSNLCCPPFTPTPAQTQQVIDCYSRALLVHCTGDVSPTTIASTLERDLFLAGYFKALGYGAGPCDLCEDCNLEACTKPRQARPAMEACGIDVFTTVRSNGYPLEVVRNRSCKDNYYGLILID